MSLYQKHRPAKLDEVVGNQHVVSVLASILKRTSTIPHALLFSGPSGCGKTTLARIMAKELGCHDIDLQELDTADFRGIDTVRAIREQMRLSAMCGKSKAYILDECHQLTKDAQSALLKALEDSPSHVYFMLCTTDAQKLLPTIRNRCTSFEVSLLESSDMLKLLGTICKVEGIKMSRSGLNSIVKHAAGSPRAAISALDKIRDLSPEDIESSLKKILVSEAETIELCRALLNGAKWPAVSGILRGLSDRDPEQIRRAVLGYCSAILTKSDNPRVFVVLDSFSNPTYNNGMAEIIRASYIAVNG